MSPKGKLYLLPMTLGDVDIETVIPHPSMEFIVSFKFLIVENIKTTRRYLKKLNREVDIDSITFFELHKHTDRSLITSYLNPCKEGNDVGILSEAGCPAVADPGSDVVSIAHKNGIEVVPMVGPSSILLALMASGFNGQKFAFTGYLSKDKSERLKELRTLERFGQSGFTQIFMETPFRNQSLLEDLLQNCQPDTLLCIACDITLPSEQINTKTIKEWQSRIPNLQKRPCIFVLGK